LSKNHGERLASRALAPLCKFGSQSGRTVVIRIEQNKDGPNVLAIREGESDSSFKLTGSHNPVPLHSERASDLYVVRTNALKDTPQQNRNGFDLRLAFHDRHNCGAHWRSLGFLG